MNIYSTNFSAPRVQGYVSKRIAASNSISENNSSSNMPSKNINGNHTITLRKGYLHSEGSPFTGQELHMKYDENSTEDNPIILAIGKDINGNEFSKKVYINEIELNKASYVEMTALDVHLREKEGKGIISGSCLHFNALIGQKDINATFDIQQYYENLVSTFKNAGYRQDADKYKSELERYLFYFGRENKSKF